MVETLHGKNQFDLNLNIRWFLLVLEFPGTYDCIDATLLCIVLDKLSEITVETESCLINWLKEYSKERFGRLVNNLKEVLEYRVSYI